MNTLIRHKVRQWLGLDRQEDRYVQYRHRSSIQTRSQAVAETADRTP